ncbi:MAG: c-type cytochrome [Phycisphaerales bacterium JB063]
MRTDRVASSVAELLMAIDPAGLAVVADDLAGYLDDPLEERRALAMAVMVRSGKPLAELAQRDRVALLGAVASMSPEQLPATAVDDLKRMVEQGTLNVADAIVEIARLTTQKADLFAWLAGMVDPARDLGFDQWGADHTRAMAALQGMHTFAFEDWPAGYEDYAVAQAEPEFIEHGRDLYYEAEEGCVKCHGQHGEGVEGYPPLANSPWVLGNPQRAAAIVAHGLTGPLVMPDGQAFEATMDPVQKGSNFSDADVAAILTFVRQSWGNYASAVTFVDVQAAPAPADGGSWHTDKLLEQFPMKYDRLLASSDAPAGPSIRPWTAPPGGLWVMLATVLGLNAILGGLTFLANRKA